MKAIAYIRVSTEDQRLGPEAQREAIETFARREGYEIVSFHVDQGVSGASPIEDRPALQEAILAARDADALLVAKRDRLARDTFVAMVVERALPKRCRLLSADGSGNGQTPADQLMRTILDGMASYERALIRSRTKAALQAKRARGERVGAVPYGYVLVEGSKLVPHAAEQETIQRVRDLHDFGYPQRRIGSMLAYENRLSRCGKPFSLTQVRRILGLDVARVAA